MQWKVEMRRITLVKSVIMEATHTMLPYSLYIMWMVRKSVEGIVLYCIIFNSDQMDLKPLQKFKIILESSSY